MFKKAAVVAGAVVVAVGASTTPAYAHVVNAYQGLDHSYTDANHARFSVRDLECDGNRVYATARLADGRSIGVADQDRCDGGPSDSGWLTGPIVSIDVCENGEGCSPLVRVT